jgi:putative ABC transport system permease protein
LGAAVSPVFQDARLAVRNVVRQRRRSAIGLASIAAGVTCLILASGFIDWIYWAMRESTIGSRLGHIQVVRMGFLERGAANPFAFLQPDKSATVDSIRTLPGVTAVAPRLALSGLISHGDATVSFIGEGIDATLEAPLNRHVVMAAGEPLAASQPSEIIVGKGLADNLGVKVGDTVTLIANRQSGGINAVEVKVRGLFSTTTKAYDDNALRIPIATAKKLLRVSGVHAWVVILDDTARTDAIVERIGAMTAGEKLDVVPWHRLADFYNKTVSLFSKQVGVLKLIIAAIIVLSISNTLTMSVLERTAEIGTMMALGARKATILRRFIGEGAVMGVLGGLVGALVGIALAAAISAVGIPMPAPPGMAHGFVGEVRTTLPLVFDAFLLGVTTALLASVYPAWKASRMAIVDALRYSR